MIHRIPRVIHRQTPPISDGAHRPYAPKPPPALPPDALSIFFRWRLARHLGDVANENHALGELRELAARPRTKTDDSQAGPDRYAASRVEGG